MSAHHEKAQRYIGLLESARVAGNWRELPELIRKVNKHAPDRKSLVEIAKAELEIAQYATTAGRQPATTATSRPLSEALTSSLRTLAQGSNSQNEEAIQAQTALLWSRWVEPQGQASPIPTMAFEPARTAADAPSTWTKICVVKAVYMRGMLLVASGDQASGHAVHKSLLPWLDSNRSLIVSTPQLLYWVQQLLGRVALSKEDDAPFVCQAFRHWAVLAAKSQDTSPLAYGNGSSHLSRHYVWRSYYRFLSDVLHRGLSAENYTGTPSELASEIRRVESSYENELLKTAHFPKATESNTKIEQWVEEAILNWQVLRSPSWSESDLGDGGRNSLGRNTLDILYRAAAKTFQSVLILRRLFQVHKSLADFELAYKALDTYIELMDRGRARAVKSTQPSVGLDSEEIYMRTLAEGIEGLCSYGRPQEAEKAFELSLKLEGLLDEAEPSSSPDGHVANGDAIQPNTFSVDLASPTMLDTIYRAIGIGKAHWARWTPFNENRSSLQTQAIEILKKAAVQDVPAHQHLATYYALARLLAETREIDAAIAVVKRALGAKLKTDADTSSDTHFFLQRSLLPFWHLLSLLLTARQDYENAARSCLAAFEQFPSPEAIFGRHQGEPQARDKSSRSHSVQGLVDDMECDELQGIIEIRITELALKELAEGHEHAVNSSNDLLALYSRLYSRLGLVDDKPRKPSVALPKSSAGTVKSLRGSLFQRKRGEKSIESQKGTSVNGTMSIAEESTRPNTTATQTTQAPTIHVTDEDEKPSPHKHHLFRSSREEKRSSSQTFQNSGSKRSRSRSCKRNERGSEKSRQSFDTTQEKPPSSDATAETAQPTLEPIQSGDVPEAPIEAGRNQTEKDHEPLKSIPHNLAPHDKVPPPIQHDEQPPHQDTRLPMLHSHTTRTEFPPRFPKASAQRHALALLAKIWLVIAALYRRANMFEDSKEACDEAAKAAARVESLVATVESSARAFADPGWGCGNKSSDEIWADVYCERAVLLMAVATSKKEPEAEQASDGIREAVDHYEQCLMYSADHPRGIVGLSNVLLDYYERKVELAKKIDNGQVRGDDIPEGPTYKRDGSRIVDGFSTNDAASPDVAATVVAASVVTAAAAGIKEDDLKKTPENLNRLAARDRAYGLLSTLTKLGSGWDNSESWFALARAHELGGEINKAKEILWWCVELEDTRPIRHWRNLGCGGYVL